MARRCFYVIDIVEILVHWHAGRSQHELADSLGVDRKTIRKYVAPAVAAGMVPGGVARSRAEWAELVRGWFPELADTTSAVGRGPVRTLVSLVPRRIRGVVGGAQTPDLSSSTV
jgi:hypothetical protein